MNDTPDLALLDILMPGGTSVGLAKEAVALDVPVIFMSGDHRAVERIEAAGLEGLRKPFSIAALAERVHETIAASRRARETMREALAMTRQLRVRQLQIVARLAATHSMIDETLRRLNDTSERLRNTLKEKDDPEI